ncbi:unnamed protein product [Leptidea sinapis]|uniref:Uncharacterized protein n=1 Tax=Leptidea sinapis TaxID=189913 RepID=A0A5E4Q5G5_9NEOP|nr:unnamed protein product [Leptidea sinapis]
MLITILGLPLSTKYHEIKVLITQKCGIPDFILDNLLTDTDGTKKVRVGLADDAEGAHVIKCLNGYKLSGNVLRVVPFGKSGIARQNNSAPNHRSTFETQGYQNDFNQMGRSQVDPWGSHSQWTPQQQTGHIQNQNNLSYQQVQQGGGYVSVNRQGVLRTVEIVETPPQNLPGRHQPNYDLQRDRNGHEQKMDSYEKSDYGKYMPQDKRILKEQLAMKYKELDKPQYDPHEKKMLKEQLAMKYKHLEKSQYSPQNMHARGLQPRQVSPSPRHSPGRKMTGRMRSPPRRSVSPHGRRLSPPGRRLSPSGRRPSPSAGRTSPMGRSRRMSPGRRVSPAGRNPMEPPVDRRMPSSGMMAHGRPASNQEMYSGGYRPNDTAQYNLQNVRSEGSSSRWTVRDKHFGKNLDDDRRDVLRMAKFETPRSSDTARVIEDVHGPRSSNRGSRSPRRERSPLRDRYRRHSPSPRSPRRSWALEKRRSPEVPDEAPPPPVWTAESPKQADYRDSRHSYTHAEQTRRQWVPISQSKKEEEARVRQSRHDSRERIRQEAQEMHFRAEEKEQVDFLKIKEDLTRRIEQKAVILKKQEELQKEIEDVYKRAVDFTKKAERHRKGDQRRDDHSAVEKQAQRDIRFDRKDEKRPKPQNNSISFAIKTKRQKATEELADKILSKFGENLPELIKAQVFEQICDAVSKILNDMYSDNDVSFIEAVIKFNSRHNVKDEEKIFDNVMSKFPLQYRVLKRSAEECVPPPPKTPKMATDVAVRKPQHVIAKKPRLVAAKPSEPPKKYTPVEKDEGSAHVTVTPCYRFMKCPEGLKTKFVDESDAEKDTSLVSENAEKKSEDTTEIIKSADESQKINDGNKKEDELKVAKTIKIEEADNTNKVETAREIAIEANTNISEKMKTEEPSMPQKITSKIIPDVKKEVSKAEEGKKMEVNKNKLTKVNETTIEKSSPQVESVEKTLKDTNAKIVENKPTVKQEFVKNVAKIQTQGKTITKPVNSLQAQTKRVEVKKNLKNVSKADDFEEMADDEILALLSSGVVLDECGSDEE